MSVQKPVAKRPRFRSPDRNLHAIARFAPFPSHTPGLSGSSRGEKMRAFLRGMFAQHAEAFAHATRVPNPRLADLLGGDSQAFIDAVAREPILRERTNLYGHRPLHLATMLGETQVVERLLEGGAEVSAVDNWDNTPLHWARMVGDDALADRLLAAGALPEATNAFGGTPLDYARLLGDVDAHTLEAPYVWVMEGSTLSRWDAERVAATVGFRPWVRSQADNDFIFDVFLRSRGSQVRRAEIRRVDDLRDPAPIALKHFGGALGWGVVTINSLPRGAYIGDYGGRIAHILSASDPNNAYSCNLGEYQWYVRVVVRARREGTLLSRANGSTTADDANMNIRVGWSRGEPRLVMRALTDLPPGEQLLWYYGRAYWSRRGNGPQKVDSLEGSP